MLILILKSLILVTRKNPLNKCSVGNSEPIKMKIIKIIAVYTVLLNFIALQIV